MARAQWRQCSVAGCRGAQARGHTECVLHILEPVARELLASGHFDGRGISFGEGDLDRLVSALPRDEQGRPAFETADFEDAVFGDGVAFDKADFKCPALFGGSVFDGDAYFEGARFRAGAHFGKTTFSAPAYFSNAEIHGDAHFAGARFAHLETGGTTFFGAAMYARCVFEGFADFAAIEAHDSFVVNNARFDQLASFSTVSFRGTTSFRNCRFAESAEFDGATMSAGCTFHTSKFGGKASFAAVRCDHDLDFTDVHSEQTLGLTLRVRGQLSLADLRADGPVTLDTHATRVDMRGARFVGGAQLRVTGEVDLRAATFGAPSMIAPTDAWRAPGKEAPDRWGAVAPALSSLESADVRDLALSGVDLSKCRFRGAHNLDQLRLQAGIRLPQSPGGRWTLRSTLWEEHLWRQQHGFEGWGPAPDEPADPITATEVASVYRGLRKGREDAKDHPGAADFYYGEMEMRRHAGRDGSAQASTAAESRLIFAYWLLSGYGLRASRPLVALVLTVLCSTVAVDAWGFEPDRGIGQALLFAIGSGIAFGAAPEYAVTDTGSAVRILLRILGPLLLGLALLAIRNRVRR